MPEIDFVLNRMRRKLSQQYDSTDFEPQSDLITTSQKVGIGTRLVEKPSKPALGEEICLSSPSNVSEISSAFDEICLC
ncbi:hypothetical protein PPACK8108_LOCUS2706 [Phakopsora pachyrhizi]|uniref:Uncharacterized protein n=1 Tax=Phakopsora pachyrhizi TaxID=170000 RepID=A0AAV0AM80_PHAPC|nr:hypothetical protein PPACK8108_LOCUS2706 [Phakopsora pachyrhizi]